LFGYLPFVLKDSAVKTRTPKRSPTPEFRVNQLSTRAKTMIPTDGLRESQACSVVRYRDENGMEADGCFGRLTAVIGAS
jgi:hypothetical protein